MEYIRNDNFLVIKNGLLVIDGDWLCFKVAAGLETRSVQIYDQDGVFIKKFKNKTLYKSSSSFNESFEIRDSQVLKNKYKEQMDERFEYLINTYLRKTNCTKVLIAMGGKTNFRNDLDLPVKYKANREGETRPLALYEARDRIIELYPYVFSENEEADDIISKFQFRNSMHPEERIVVCTLDKDARGTPGLLYNPDKDTLVNIEGIGFLSLSKPGSSYKLYGEGRKWFYSQLLTGDKADNYFPCDYYKVLIKSTVKAPIITPYKCFNLLSDCKTDLDCLTVIKNTYLSWYKDIDHWYNWKGEKVEGTWVDLLQVYFDVVHMRRFDNDRVDVKNLLQKFGLLDE